MVVRALDYVPHCYSSDDSAVVACGLRDAFARHGAATLSFDGVADVTSSFINSAIVSLLDTYSADWLKAHLRMVGATSQIGDMVRRCLANALRQPEAA